jgi:hypothetical protein
MKNSHVVLLNLLFIGNFMFAANPAPDKKEEEKGTFDRCFDSPGGFAKCAAVGTVAVGATGLVVWASGGILSPWMGRIGSSVSSVFESKPAPKHEPKPAAAPKPAPAPAKKEEPKPAPSSPKRSGITRKEVAVIASGCTAAGFALGAVIEPAVSTAVRLGAEDIYKEATGKRAKEDKQREEQVAMQKEALDIQRRAVAAQEAAIRLQERQHAENVVMHMRSSEQNEKALVHGKSLKQDINNLSKQMAEFAGAE